jgi:hypothetical protein
VIFRSLRRGIALVMLGAGSAALAASPSNFAAEFPGRILAAHNLARVQAGAVPLAWDAALANGAAAYAQQMAFTNIFAHSNRKARPGTGETLWMGTRGAFAVETMVGGWTSERRFFAPGVFPAVSRSGNWADVGHYTQMIWPTTTRVGCAIATNASTDYLVCRYSPAGNIDGRALTGRGVATALNRR